MKIAIIIFAVITIFALWYLIVSVGSYFEAKENRIKRSLLEPVSPEINSSMIERLDFENQFLTLIDDLLNTEIACMIKSYMILGNPYPIINLDRDVKTLSDTVYNAIKKAMNMSGKISETVAHKIGEEIYTKHANENTPINISEIETDVFNLLVKHGHKNTAKSYEGYTFKL